MAQPNSILDTIQAALTEYEYTRRAFYDGDEAAIAAAERAKLALAWLKQAREAGTWEPVEDEFKTGTLTTWNDDIGEGDGTPDWRIAIEKVATRLPDDIRLCLRTPAPASPQAD